MKQPEPARSPEALSGERESSRDKPAFGELIDERYRVIELLGSGGMADVYEVEHIRLGRRFALKLLREELGRDADLKARFEREARAVAKLSSEHIVAIVDSGSTAQGAVYFVMERLHGRELRQLLQADGALPLQRALHVALDVCRALEVAHAAGVIHRDLKPENLFLVRDAHGRDHCKVLDFGVAKLSGENPTLPGTLMGTARYMAPEQIAGGVVGPTTDVFALGVILFECLAGHPPFEGDTLERVLYRIVSEPTPPLLEQRPELPAELGRLLERMLAKAPDDRPQSARAVADVLSEFTLEARSSTSGATDHTLLEAAPALPFVSPAGKPAPRPAKIGPILLSFGLGLAAGSVLALSFRTAPSATTAASAASASAVVTLPAAPTPPPSTTPAPVSADADKPSVTAVPAVSPTPSSAQRPAAKASATSDAAPLSKPPLFYPQDSKP
ncbi:MAG TPA: serine/threonine-protein kinase [Polyangiaceae bacterium]|nr:serine/threonine-protein kinase [Polyangiaceae bacterium]